MEFVSAILGPVVKLLMGHITQKLGYLTSSTEHVKRMQNRMQFLEGQSTDIEEHMKENNVSNLKIPARVPGWLKEVKKYKEEVDYISSNDIGCFDVKKKCLAGRNALRLIEDIEGLIKESSDIIWRDVEIPLGRVDSKRLASKPGGVTQNLFKSRDKTFNDALKLLQQDDRVIALCGMGGVGKTTLMNQLIEAAEDNKIFKWILVAVIGNTPNLFAIQKAIAAHIGEPLTETDETLRATYLTKMFKGFAKRKEKVLLILDDVWEKIKLEDIGLACPLPDGVKLLLTSRYVNICQQIAINADSVLKVVKVEVLEEGEARDFFSRISGISAEHDHDFYQIGCDIVKKCGCLPLAIKLIAATLKCQNKFVWRRTLKRLKKNDLDKNVQKIIKISYESLVHDDKVILLFCGMFPEDYNIPIEDLTRYAWGLKLLEQVSTMEDARESTQTSVSSLKNAYLLMDGDNRHSDCVKMHDLVLAFVVGTVSKGGEEGCWLIHHDDFSKWREDVNMSHSCKQISLVCNGMSEFPSGFKFPNLTVLKLMHGDESLRFPQDFYVGMENLEVIAFEKLEYPLVPTSFQCSANLRTLCLDECSLMLDLTCIGNLLNLEVLSFANSGITILPSTFKNLKKLRLLDVTGSYNLVIDDGVLKSLVKLEELYMIAFNKKKPICFTDNNCSELADRSGNLCALEFEFISNDAHMKNMSYEKLKRFKLSVGCYFTEVRDHVQTEQVDMHSYENSLKLVTNREELLKSKINELFKMTYALYLQVSNMKTLEDVDVESPHPRHAPRNSSFYNLRVLVVSGCGELKYLFTPNVATNLSKLEYLEISRCATMEAVIHTENNGSYIIEFLNLKYLRLAKLPKLLCFCDNNNVIELPQLVKLNFESLPHLTNIYQSSTTSYVSSDGSRMQSLFNKEDATPKLEKLFVSDMENLKEIWPPQFNCGNLCLLRELMVKGCDSIVVLFNIYFDEIEQLSGSLRITVEGCDSLVKLFSCNPFPFLNNLQELKVERCGSIQVLFNTDLGRAGKLVEQVRSSCLRSIVVKKCDSLLNLLPKNPMPLFNNLEELEVENCSSIQVLFNIDIGSIGKIEELLCSSSLRIIKVDRCDSLLKLFSSNPFPIFKILQEIQVRSCDSIQVLFDIDSDSGRTGNIGELLCTSSLRSIKVSGCDSLVKLFSCNPFPLFNNLQELKVRSCDSIQVLFDIDSGHTGNIGEQVCTSSLRSIEVSGCDSLVDLLPSNPMPLFNHLEELSVFKCPLVEVIFNINMRCAAESDKVSSSSRSRLKSLRLMQLGKLREVWRIKDAGNNLIHGFEAIESIFLDDCERFENLITPATTIFDMRALKHVDILDCGRENERRNKLVEINQHQEIDAMSILGEYSNDEISKVALPSYLLHTFHHLRELDLWRYKAVEVVFEITSLSSRGSAHNTQQPLILPYLEELKLNCLERMSHVWKCNWNEYLILQKQEAQCSFHNLTTIKMYKCNSIKYLFSPLMAKLLLNLEKVHINSCDGIEEVVSNRYDKDTSLYSHINTSLFSRLDNLKLAWLPNFKCIGGSANGILNDTHDQLKFSQLSWFLCQYSREISIASCAALSSAIPWYAVEKLQNIQVLKVEDCESMTEVFETQEINNKSGTETRKSLARLEYVSMLKLPKLKILKIQGCDRLKHLFTFSTLESLTELEELEIKDCKSMEVIVKKDNGEETTASDVVVFPRLKSLALVKLPNVVGFFLGKNEFIWPTLEKVVISECPNITVFTCGRSATPKLNCISTSLGKHSVECGLNFCVTTASHQARLPSYECKSSYCRTTMEQFPWSYHNLIEVNMDYNPSGGGQTLFSSDKLLQLQKLETVHCSGCGDIEVIFDSPTVAEIPNLRQVDLMWLSRLKYIWKSKQRTALQFPNLTQLTIERCDSLEYVFTCSMVGSILQLRELHISFCNSMKVIVKGDEECDAIVNAIVMFPCLKSLKLVELWSLGGFCLGREAFSFPSLDTLKINQCPRMTVFTKGDFSTPKLHVICTENGKFNIHNRLNSFMNTLNKRD